MCIVMWSTNTHIVWLIFSFSLSRPCLCGPVAVWWGSVDSRQHSADRSACAGGPVALHPKPGHWAEEHTQRCPVRPCIWISGGKFTKNYCKDFYRLLFFSVVFSLGLCLLQHVYRMKLSPESGYYSFSKGLFPAVRFSTCVLTAPSCVVF